MRSGWLNGILRQLLASERDLSAAQSWLLLAPILALFVFVFLLPILGIARLSLFDPEFTLDYYRLLLSDSLFISVLWRTLWISAVVTACCLLLGYPVAALMTRTYGRTAAVIAVCVLVPLWLSVLVRSYAWVVLLARNGVITTILRDHGLIDPSTRLIYTDGAVIMAMTHVLLPFMVLPLYSALNAIPRDLAAAAQGLGASQISTYFRITLPLSLPGVFSGCVLVFVVALGFFVTPQLVGGPNAMMASMLISREATYGNNWGLASAISVVLFVLAVLVVAVFGRFTRNNAQRRRAA